MPHKPILYIKATCPWCVEAIEFFDQTDVELDVRDINKTPAYRDELVSKSGQSRVPTFIYKDFVVADFDVEEFTEALSKREDIKETLGLY